MTEGSGNYWLRHWRGGFSASHAYWINTFGLNLILGLLLGLMGMVAYGLPLMVVPFLSGLVWTLVIVVPVWQAVGVARSVLREIEEQGKILRPVLLLGALILLLSNTALSVAKIGVPQLVDAWNVLNGDPQISESVITLLPSGTELEFSGGIKLHSAAKLATVLAEHPAVKVLQLDSLGGREREAVAMADVVRQHGLSTYIGTNSASAAVLVFLAGRERVLREDAKVGLHSARAPGVPTDRANARLEEILRMAGADSVFVSKVLGTSADAIWYPEPRELLEQGLATRISDGTGFSMGTRELAKFDEKGLRKELAKVARYRALALQRPRPFELSVDAALHRIRAGTGLKASLSPINDLARQTAVEALPYASDEALDLFIAYDLEFMRRNMYRLPLETLHFLHQQGINPIAGGNVEAPLLDRPKTSEDLVMTALIASPPNPSGINFSSASVHEVLLPIRRFLKSPKEEALFYQVPENKLEQIAACELWQAFLQDLLRQPKTEANPLKRYMLGRAIAQPAS